MRAATGPAISRPSGAKASEPNQSYELTRDRAASGTSRWMVVAHNTPKMSAAMPEANMASAIHGTGARTASRAIGRASGKVANTAVSTGRCTRRRAASPAPVTVPSACAATISDQDRAPPSPFSAISGPSTPALALSAATTTEYCATTTHSHCRPANSRQPSRRSAHPDDAVRARAGSRRPRISSALTTNYAALSASAQPAPTTATATPDSASPSSIELFIPTRSSPFARCSRGAGTSSGTTPSIAGENSAVAVPASAARAQSAHRGVPGQHHGGESGVRGGADEIGDDHQPGARHPVREHPAGQDEHQLWHRLTGQHQRQLPGSRSR